MIDRNHSLSVLGWDSYFQTCFDQSRRGSSVPARVTGVHKNRFTVHDGLTEKLAVPSGKLLHQTPAAVPVVGDWVLIDEQVIVERLPRKNHFSRAAAGSRGKQDPAPERSQVMAANLDAVFIVTGTDRDFNVRRIERYLTLVYHCGLNPVIVLTKADLHPDPQRFVHQVESVTFGVPVHLVHAGDDQGLVPLAAYLSTGRTVTMVGSSGAGKSTLLNRLNGSPVQTTNGVSEKLGKGRHTTTSRRLIILARGGMVIDNPGIREVGFQGGVQGLDGAFPEIEKLAAQCRFNDCTHTSEPGCQVLAGLADGTVTRDRLAHYRKMQRELDYSAQRQHKSADRLEKERWQWVSQKQKALKRSRYKR